ncbi:DUF6660 family protein [Pedobacter psychrotolerans]|uniref:DUF6660 family protein n=1 Tax=Pedobacter psychrotolerans TaxID=1843235 RepID=UPI00105351FF|nr:DUF6660 family protein [Pedobacter psychrotolerans]
MKILIYFLSLAILLLSCITCEDQLNLDLNLKRINTITKISKTESIPDNDHCSPLCTCNCCGQPIVNISNDISVVKPKLFSLNKKKSGYKSRNVTDYTQNIWQPPKLNNVFIV